MRAFYSDTFTLPLPPDHRFPMEKYRRLRQAVLAAGLVAAEELQVPFLGEVPINVPIRKFGDAGDMDAVFADPVSGPELESLVYRLCRNLADDRSAAPAMPTLPRP